MTAEEIIDLVAAQVDTAVVPETTLLVFLNARHAQAVAESLWRSAEVSIGPTVAGQSRYSLPADVVDLRLVFSGTFSAPAIYSPAGQTQVLQVRDSSQDVWVTGPGAGVFTCGADTAGVAYVDLEPAPDTAGVALVGLAPIQPAALTNASSSSPILPVDFHMGLMHGVKADALRYQDEREDLAAANEALFDRMVLKLAARKNSRVGSGPLRAGVSVAGR